MFCWPCASHVCNFHYGAEQKLTFAPQQQLLIKSTARIKQQLIFVLVPSCHSHSDLCNVYPVALDRTIKDKHCQDHYDYDKKNKIQSNYVNLDELENIYSP